MGMIYHITQRHLWEDAEESGSYRADSLKSEGFIHCSRWDQVVRTANKYFLGVNNLVLLEIDEEKVFPEVRHDPVENDQFPHIYGPLNASAVRRVWSFKPESDGNFRLPE